MKSSLYALFFYPWMLPLSAAEPSGIETHLYKKVEGRELKLTVQKPAVWQATDKRPAVVFFHGGGWVGGKPVQFSQHSEYLAGRGLVCVQVEYRLLKDSPADTSPLVCIQDAKSAMRWVRSHAPELGIDPARIAAGGGSAGGHLAAFTGMVEGLDDPKDDLSVSAKANALLLYNPVFDNGPNDGWGTARVKNRYQEFSPAHNITADDPPTIVFLGTADKLIPVSVVERFKSGMEKAGVRCETRYYEDQPHGFFNAGKNNNKYYVETLRETDLFLASLGWLQGEPTVK